MTYGDMGDASRIRQGWDVFGAAGEKVGDVKEIGSNYLVVSRGFLFTTERYIPYSAISAVENARIYLNVTKEEIESLGWDRPEAMTAHDESKLTGTAMGTGMETERESMTLREERLRTGKHEVEAGSVDVEKEVVAEQVTREVPVTREEVDIEYRPVEGVRAAQGDLGEGEIHMPLREEEVTVEKDTVVTGEVDVQKRRVQDTEEITEEVRRERPRIRREGDADIDVHVEPTELEGDRPQ